MTPRLAVGDKALITTQAWFYAPDGKQYRAAFGTIHAIERAVDAIGIAPPRPHTSWYLRIGNMTIAGCQILYAVRAEACELGRVRDWSAELSRNEGHANSIAEFERPSAIYNADEEAAAT